MLHHYSLLKCRLLLAGLLTLAVAACTENHEEAPAPDNDYYPVALGAYRTYDVLDSIWTDNALTINRYQFRERVASAFEDASGQTAYRIIRSRRATSSDTWQDDSTMLVLPTASSVQLTRNNRRTVELVFPVRAAYAWNRDAFNQLDTVTAQNRRYEQIGQAFQAGTQRYEQTVTTEDTEVNTLTGVTLDDGIQQVAKYRQVYARGVGLVFRRKRRITYCRDGSCIPSPTNIYRGLVHRETLTESGQL